MWVPATLAASTSPSLAKVPPVIDTVALVRLRLSTSETASVGEIWMVVPAVNVTVGVTEVTVGASLMAVRVTVVGGGALWTLKSRATGPGPGRGGAGAR